MTPTLKRRQMRFNAHKVYPAICYGWTILTCVGARAGLRMWGGKVESPVIYMSHPHLDETPEVPPA